ncbi:unnamed protein product [Tetraodon nigroviridis]|uniref:(spotted green pufferfish) hypothetical protein n=1 Tax=Tetraodon nigroviridis TaxID=99883 RepID=Q4RW55_TETNG|nr:unnamed protein product [Tetraodon nigroviridis]
MNGSVQEMQSKSQECSGARQLGQERNSSLPESPVGAHLRPATLPTFSASPRPADEKPETSSSPTRLMRPLKAHRYGHGERRTSGSVRQRACMQTKQCSKLRRRINLGRTRINTSETRSRGDKDSVSGCSPKAQEHKHKLVLLSCDPSNKGLR